MDLFEAVVKLSKAHSAAAGLEITRDNQRNGIERLLRLESITESEFDECLAIQKDFYSSTEIEKIRAGIRGPVTSVVKRK